jgi:ergothioneine biosynthesis protein EgtB
MEARQLSGHGRGTASIAAPADGVGHRTTAGSALAAALRASRADTLATFERYEAALADPALAVPLRAGLNPPRWELGHIGWFQEYWLARNPQRSRGVAADPHAPRAAGVRPAAEALYDSSAVAHDTRWSLPLPDAAATRRDLDAQLTTTLALLEALPPAAGDDALYFFRLALFHEDMHHEAALYMAQDLGIAIDDARWQPPLLGAPGPALAFAAGPWRLGFDGPGFAFDNELGAHEVMLPAASIDAQVLRWREFLPFVEQGGHAERRWWTEAGWAWRERLGRRAPRYLARDGGAWHVRRWGRLQALDLDEPACHLSLHEAEAWCRWAGRRLPTEAEWERAALQGGAAFRWGDVWEWTASEFMPYPGFVPHPYRDYSAPWFGSRRVLRGGSFMTQPRMQHPRYRNFFAPGRDDIPAGLRSCAA